MNKKFNVVWADVVETDLVNIIDYISEENPLNALKLFEKIKSKTSNLYSFPGRGRIIPELLDHGIMQYRELIIAPWRIIYKITGSDVYILAVLDSRQNIEDLLLKRLININQ
jgi:toxin ParE1/3/4